MRNPQLHTIIRVRFQLNMQSSYYLPSFSMAFDIEITVEAEHDLATIKPFYRAKILDGFVVTTL